MTPALSAPRVAALLTTTCRRVEPEHRRTGSKVRAGSRLAGEQLANRRLRFAEAALHKRALEAMARETRAPGKVRGVAGTLGWADEKVHQYLIWFQVRTGEVFPSAKAIAEKVGCAMSTVHAAKARLKAAGWLDWTRRCVPTGNVGRRGPQVRQISNWYHLRLPPRAEALIAAFKARRGPPSDAAFEVEKAWRASARQAFDVEEIEASRLRWRADQAERLARARHAVSPHAVSLGLNANPTRLLNPDPRLKE